MSQIQNCDGSIGISSVRVHKTYFFFHTFRKYLPVSLAKLLSKHLPHENGAELGHGIQNCDGSIGISPLTVSKINFFFHVIREYFRVSLAKLSWGRWYFFIGKFCVEDGASIGGVQRLPNTEAQTHNYILLETYHIGSLQRDCNIGSTCKIFL